jgi:hypothetical protein
LKTVKIVRALVGVMTLGAAGCGESSDPRSPNGPTPANHVVGTTGGVTPMKIAPPVPVAPADGSRVDTRQPTLVVENPVAAHSPAAILRVRFVVQDQAGATLHVSAPVELGSGSTRYTLPLELPPDQSFRWSADAIWNDTPGASSAARSFITPVPPGPPPPPPVDTCAGTDPIDVVTCQRGRTPGTMDEAELLDFVKRLAVNLNRNGIGGGPFGVLRKAAGTNCGGYSCDILCAGQGGGQRQWDVLHDIDGSQAPTWYGPKQGGQIRVDVCEIQ